jgi:outer membrane protein OmpA-like peptidoglycan-associated protein
MRYRGSGLRALLTFSTVLACGGVAAVAATYAVTALIFQTSPISFGIKSLSFPANLIKNETANAVEVTLPADILFNFDKSDVRADAQPALHEVALFIREKGRGQVTVQGFTDSFGGDAYNQRLSERRAGAVRTWLATREGLASVRFATIGFGSRNPVAPNRNADGSDNPEGRQMNRRVTLIVQK